MWWGCLCVFFDGFVGGCDDGFGGDVEFLE